MCGYELNDDERSLSRRSQLLLSSPSFSFDSKLIIITTRTAAQVARRPSRKHLYYVIVVCALSILFNIDKFFLF